MEREFVIGRVSVIIPVYNCGKYISRALESVYAQNYENIEIVLVDDKSSDNSAEIILEHKKFHPEIIYYLQEKNQGAGVARNKALELATGQYVAFLDSDDVWKKNKLEKQIDFMIQTGTPFSYTAIEMIDKDNNLIKGKRNLKTECNYKNLLHNTIIATSSVVIDRGNIGDFRMSLRRGGQDYATWLMLLKGGIVAKGINEALVMYRILDDSLSSNKFKSIVQLWDIQRNDEKIAPLVVMFNIFLWGINVIRKYFI